MLLCRTAGELEEALGSLPKPMGLVPTMGALHAGHLALARVSTAENAATVASVFVNPAQFGATEDLRNYPRDLERDAGLLDRHGVHVTFAPAVEEMYPPGFATWVVPDGPPAARLEAERRPGHFRGVATVVTKLLLLVRPDVVYFGQKDAQQLAVIRRLVADLHVPCRVAAVATVRDPDGLALSSRNVYLSPPQRRAATVLSRALRTAQQAFASGERDSRQLLETMRQIVEAEPGATLDYVDLADPDTFAAPSSVESRTLALIACMVGPTRLIDNTPLGAPLVGGR